MRYDRDTLRTSSWRYRFPLDAGLGAIALIFCPSIARAAQSSSITRASSDLRDFEIGMRPLSVAILQFSNQAGVQLVVEADIVSGIQSNIVKGRLSIPDALDRLLAGTGLGWRYLDAGTITVRKLASAPARSTRTFGVVRIEGRQESRPGGALERPVSGSSDLTATEGTGSFAADATSVASKAPRSNYAVAQTISVLTQDRLVQQSMPDLATALRQMPGITMRTFDGISGETLVARGFEIHSFTFDGGGPTFYQSSLDADARTMLEMPELAQFDHVEVLRGSPGLFGGIGNPGGVVNLQRKRPLDHAQAIFDLRSGSWNDHRIEADITGPIAFDGRLRTRVIGVYQDRDFFYDVAGARKHFLHGMIEADIGAHLVVRAGGNYRRHHRPGFNVGGLPRFTSGADFRLPRDTCLCWPRNDYLSVQQEQFLSAEWTWPSNWALRFNGSTKTQDSGYNANIIQILSPAPLSLSAVHIFNNAFDSKISQHTFDINLVGKFKLLSSDVKFVAGMDYLENSSHISGHLDYLGEKIISHIPRNIVDLFEGATSAVDLEDIADQEIEAVQYAPYFTAEIYPVQNVTINIGARKSFHEVRSRSRDGNALRFFEGYLKSASRLDPTLSLSYQSGGLNFYVSSSHMYQPQLLFDEEGRMLPALSGATYETGVKWRSADRKLNAAIAVYNTRLRNLALYQPGSRPQVRCCYRATASAISYGVDLEISGEIAPGWEMQASYGWNRNQYDEAAPFLTIESQQPQHQIKLWVRHDFPSANNDWSVAGGMRFESQRYVLGEICALRLNPTGVCISDNRLELLPFYKAVQPSIAIVDARLGYRLTRQWEAALNITNLTNVRYYETLAAPAGGNYYGEPRAFMLSLRGVFGS